MNEAVRELVKPSVCPLDCPDTCSLSVSVQGDRITAIRGSKVNPFTDGVICNKVARSYPEFVHGAGRLMHPMKRVGPRGKGQFEPVSWDAALDLVHEGFSRAIAQYGPQSVMPFNYAGPHGELAGGSMDRRFFHKLGATLLNRGPLCGAVRGTAYTSLYGSSPGMPPEQARQSDLVVIWGNNVTVSNLHLMRVLKDAGKRGVRVVVIDPKRTKIAERADLFIQIRPGSDVVFAMAAAAELERRGALDRAFIEEWTVGFDAFMDEARRYGVKQVEDICGLSADTLMEFVELYAGAENVAASFGNGIERGRSGGSGLRAGMALQALTGNHGRPGAGVIAKPGLSAPKTTERLQRPDLVPDGTRTFNIVDVAHKLLDKTLDPPVMATMIYNHNPVCTHPDQKTLIKALRREDLFIAGCDVVMTDSLAFADVILPAASHFEFDDVYGAYGQNYVQRAAPVIPCVGESLPNTEIFRRLAARFGFDDPIFKDDDAALMDAAFDGSDERFQGFSPGGVPLERALVMTAKGGSEPVMCKNVFPATPSGRIELYSEDLEERFGYGVPRFEPVKRDRPLILISPSSDKRTNATFGGCAESDGMEVVEIHPDNAAERGLTSGDQATVSNERGKVTLKVVVSDAVLPGVLYSPKGTWLKTSATGNTVNALIPSHIRTDIEDGACYNETFVDIERSA
ncbi:molybdopterin-containing oxidoreductase family protein [Hoeflea prorocentri]|uniref:Molybdopterin-dependent oxidoreductase n=1 Tax=Hoeflea prorocentri TaxID=1922333 RepID=A0A9X3UFL1_9HYPH|nr:molybdopterin-dependent oxidoreductase [Hoeflea prorocentri]MCY6379913.1 molybdopterin-dependent oxidoreductase [Hoeflea prorocentri]MDA5397713.1 molybdopterin-dependent oxidoreductase [Hoeflea prorocentri]